MNFITRTLTPLLESIQPGETESYSLQALGLGSRISSQSILIAFGTRLEAFFNKMMEEAGISLIAPIVTGYYKRGARKGEAKTRANNKVKVGSQNRQVDLFFTDKDGNRVYCEMKCNLNFDTEKNPASDGKMSEVAAALQADKSYYFCPVLETIPAVTQAMVSHQVIGVNELLAMVDAPFTSAEFFQFLSTDAASILTAKGL